MAGNKNILEEELELNDEQAARNDEVYNGVFDLCRMLSENRNWNGTWDLSGRLRTAPHPSLGGTASVCVFLR